MPLDVLGRLSARGGEFRSDDGQIVPDGLTGKTQMPHLAPLSFLNDGAPQWRSASKPVRKTRRVLTANVQDIPRRPDGRYCT
jgi:hypothetical protein